MWNWKQELCLDFYIIMAWITWHPFFWNKARGLSKLKIHSETERAKMYERYGDKRTLWLWVMNRDKWFCRIQRKGICTWRATQVDHIIPVSKLGRSVPSNLQAACEPCNKWKGVKIL